MEAPPKNLKKNYHAAAAKSLQSCPILCDPIGGSPPGSPVPGILQAKTLEWIAMYFSRVFAQLRDQTNGRFFIISATWEATCNKCNKMQLLFGHSVTSDYF